MSAAKFSAGQSVRFQAPSVACKHGQDGYSVIPDWFHGDGCHAVVIVGYRSMPHGRQFLLHNSWGDTWFERGYAWVSEAMVRRHVLDAFTVDVEPGPSAPRLRVPQLPQLPRANDSCVRDLFTGQCAAACRNGLPPIAGMCAP